MEPVGDVIKMLPQILNNLSLHFDYNELGNYIENMKHLEESIKFLPNELEYL